MPSENLFALATISRICKFAGMASTALEKPKAQPQQTAWRLFLTVHALACRKIDDGLLGKGCLSFDDYDVLLTVNEAEGQTMRMSELAEAVLLSNSGMSRRVARLVERKLLHREQCERDGRVFRVRLTKAGVRALDRAWEVYGGLIDEVFASHLSGAEGKMLGGVFQRILDRIGTEKHRGLLQAGVTDSPRSAS
jgi:DNA-binding MarR family transcriptional regulator